MDNETEAPGAGQPERNDVAEAVRLALEGKQEARNKLVAALAKAKLNFKPIEKNREARVTFGHDHPRAGQLAYTFKYADLAEINKATEHALAEQQLVIAHELVVKGDADYLKTSLLHEGGGELTNYTRLINEAKGQAAYAKAQSFAQRYGVRLVLNLSAEDDQDAEPENTEARDVPTRGQREASTEDEYMTGSGAVVDVEEMQEYGRRILAAFDNADPEGARLLWNELKQPEQEYVWRHCRLTDNHKNVLNPSRVKASPDPQRPNRRGRA